MDLLRLYLVNIMRPALEEPEPVRGELTSDEEEEEEEEEDEQVEEGEEWEAAEELEDEEPAEERLDNVSTTSEVDVNSFKKTRGIIKRQARSGSRASKTTEQSGCSTRGKRDAQRRNATKRSFKSIELIDLNGPKLMHGTRTWFVLYQIIGQVNWLDKPLYLSIIYKSIVIPTCVYIVWRDFLMPMVDFITITEDFKNPIFVFISLSAAVTMSLHAILTIYNNLFILCPLFKVLTTEKLCFIREEVQHIVGSKTMPAVILLFAFNNVLFRMLVARNFEEFVHNFNIIEFMIDLFALMCLGFHLVGMAYVDFYIRVCFGMWLIAMKTNLEYRFAYLQRHQRKQTRTGPRQPNGLSLAQASQQRKSTTHSVLSSYSNSTLVTNKQLADESATFMDDDGKHIDLDNQSMGSQASKVTTNTNATTATARSAAKSELMTLADFKAKYKIDTLDEIQKNLNTMDDHLEVSRDFQTSSLVLITLSAFLTNGALLLLAYNLLANQGNYYHGTLIIYLAVCYTFVVFLCYVGDSWISYALESFVQTVEDEYFLQNVNGEGGDPAGPPGGGDSSQGAVPDLLDLKEQPRRVTEDFIPSTNFDIQPQAALSECTVSRSGLENSDAGSELMPSSQLIRQHHDLFIIKKRDVLFCREFLYQFQNHLATPWSKLTVKIQLHMLGTFVTLIAAQIIFDREH